MTVINSIRRYTGTPHSWATNKPVVIVAVHRNDAVLQDDAAIGELRAGDVIEFSGIITDENGARRTSWATSDALFDEIGPCQGTFTGRIAVALVVTARDESPERN